MIALQLKDVRKNFGKTEIIRGVDLTVQAGERVAIIGPNGAGKSTLFNLISGRFEPSSGEIWLGEHRIDGKKPFEINRLGLSRSFQITNIFPKLSVFENLRCAVLWKLGYKYTFFKFLADLEDANDRAEALMERIRLDKKRDVLAVNQHLLIFCCRQKIGTDGRPRLRILGLDMNTALRSGSQARHANRHTRCVIQLANRRIRVARVHKEILHIGCGKLLAGFDKAVYQSGP